MLMKITGAHNHEHVFMKIAGAHKHLQVLMKITCAHVLCCRMFSVLVLGVLSSGVAFLAKAVGGPVTAVRVHGFSHAVLSAQYFRTEGSLKRLLVEIHFIFFSFF